MLRRIISVVFILGFAAGLSACGDTWQGAKKDTGDNLKSAGEALEKAGDKLKQK